MATRPDLVPVGSFLEAQDRVPFPVLSFDPAPDEILVRPESRHRWATVRSVHEVEGARLRVKQFVYDWSDVPGLPTNLTHGWCTFYAPPEAFRVGTRRALVGRDYEGRAAGFLSQRLVQVEASNLSDARSGPLRALLGSARAADEVTGRTLARRPFPQWSWTIRRGAGPWPSSDPAWAHLRWRATPGPVAPGDAPPTISWPGYRVEAVGTPEAPGSVGEWESWLLRSEDDHDLLALSREGRPSRTLHCDHPKEGDLPGTWRGAVDGLEVLHLFDPLTGYGHVLSDLRGATYHAVLPVVLDPRPLEDRARAVRAFRAIVPREPSRP